MSTPIPTPMPFPIRNARQLLAKAKRAIDQLDADANGIFGEPNAIAIADSTFDAACTLWHVTDWIGYGAVDVVRGVLAPRQMKKRARDRTDLFQRALRARCQDLRICWGLALHFKHFEVETQEARHMFKAKVRLNVQPVQGEDELGLSIGAADHIAIAIPVLSSVPRPLQFSHVPLSRDAGPSTSTMHPKVTYRKQRMRLTEVYGRAYTFLDRLLKKHGL